MSSKLKWRMFFLAIVVLLAATFVLAGSLDPFGKPPAFKGNGYKVWKTGGEWHLRMVSEEKKHVFSGNVRCNGNGRITHAWSVKTETKSDYGEWNDREIRFNFTAKEGSDGLDFTASCNKLEFDLMMDGIRKENRVYVGGSGANPASIPFRLDNE